MTQDDYLLNIIAGADKDDEEDIAIRRAIVSGLRQQDFDLLLAAVSCDNASAAAA
jgi:hypothetical protein